MKKAFLTSFLFCLSYFVSEAAIFEYPYKGDSENYISRFNDEISQDAFDESLFLSTDGVTAVTLQDGTVLVLVVDGSLGSVVYTVLEPDETDDPEICGFGNFHGAAGGSFGLITDIGADKWGNIAISEAMCDYDIEDSPADRVQIFRLINGEVVWQRSIEGLGLLDPEGVCIAEMDNVNSDSDNLLIIADAGNNRICVSDLQGTLIGTYYQDSGDGVLVAPCDVEWQADQTQNSEIVYVIDGGNQRIVKLQGALTNLTYEYQIITSPEPIRMTLDQYGQLFILDDFYSKIYKYHDTGSDFEYLTETAGFGTSERGEGLLHFPTGLAMAKGFPHILVTESYTEYSGAALFINDLSIVDKGVSSYMIDPTMAETTTISYLLTEYARQFSIKVYDSEDQLVRTLVPLTQSVESGEQTVTWDGKDDLGVALSEGVYTVRIEGDDPYDVDDADDINITDPLDVTIEIRPLNVHITVSDEWSGVYTVYRNLIIDNNVTLTLASGTNVKCQKGSSITVLGTLLSNGTEEEPTFIGAFRGEYTPFPQEEDLEYWEGISITSPTPNNSQFSYTYIGGAQCGVYIEHNNTLPSNVELSNVVIMGCQFGLYCLGAFGVECNSLNIFDGATGIYLDNASNVTFTNPHLYYNDFCGIYVHSSGLTLSGGAVEENGSGLEMLNANSSQITGTVFRNNGAGISTGAGFYINASSPSLVNTTIEESVGYGVYVSNSSFPLFYDPLFPSVGTNTLRNNGLAELCYVEGMAYISNGHNNFIDDALGVLIDSRNTLHYSNEHIVKYNYWGSANGPSAGQLLPENYFQYSPYDDEFNEQQELLMTTKSGGTRQIASEDDSLETLFFDGLAAEARHDTASALSIFRGLIEGSPRTAYAVASVSRIFLIIEYETRGSEERQEALTSLRSYFTQLADEVDYDALTECCLIMSRNCLALTEQWQPLMDELAEAIQEADTPLDSLFEVIALDGFSLAQVGGPIRIDASGDNEIHESAIQVFSTYLNNLRKNISLIDSLSTQTQKPPIPDNFVLNQNYPNPFNSQTQIRFGLNESSDVVISIFDCQGRQIEKLVNRRMEAGFHTLNWHAANLAAGVYFLRVKTGHKEKSIKMVLLK